MIFKIFGPTEQPPKPRNTQASPIIPDDNPLTGRVPSTLSSPGPRSAEAGRPVDRFAESDLGEASEDPQSAVRPRSQWAPDRTTDLSPPSWPVEPPELARPIRV